MKITVNGNEETIEACNIAEYLIAKGFSGDGVVVEHNYHIVKKDNWHNVQLQESDNLEVLSFVGGG